MDMKPIKPIRDALVSKCSLLGPNDDDPTFGYRPIRPSRSLGIYFFQPEADHHKNRKSQKQVQQKQLLLQQQNKNKNLP